MKNKGVFIISIVVSLAIGFGGGFIFHQYQNNNAAVFKKLTNIDSGKPQDVDFALFWSVWNDLNAKYVDKNKIDAEKALYGAISGMVNSVGDPYTVFFEPVVSKKFQEEISGAFGGVGIEVGKKNNILTVISPIKDTPAFRAGIKTGDKIVKIDGKSTGDMAVEEAVNLIRGKVGTKVTLTIVTNTDKPRDIVLTRETIKVPTVEWKMLDAGTHKVAYVQVYAFNENVNSQFKKASEEILKSNADRIIIDLRNNPGGLLDSAIYLAGWFLDKEQLVVSEVFGNGTKNEFRSDGNGSLKGYQTIFLINGGSASASEILAGAIHDNKGIKLVGEKSFGKGSVQELQKYGNGSSLKVTIAKWLTPAGISISEKGIEPDIKVELPTDEKARAELLFGEAGKDPQLDKALELLK